MFRQKNPLVGDARAAVAAAQLNIIAITSVDFICISIDLSLSGVLESGVNTLQRELLVYFHLLTGTKILSSDAD